MGWQWHQLDHVQIIRSSLQTDNHASTYLITQFFYRPDVLPDVQPTASKHWRQNKTSESYTILYATIKSTQNTLNSRPGQSRVSSGSWHRQSSDLNIVSALPSNILPATTDNTFCILLTTYITSGKKQSKRNKDLKTAFNNKYSLNLRTWCIHPQNGTTLARWSSWFNLQNSEETSHFSTVVYINKSSKAEWMTRQTITLHGSWSQTKSAHDKLNRSLPNRRPQQHSVCLLVTFHKTVVINTTYKERHLIPVPAMKSRSPENKELWAWKGVPSRM